MSLETFLERDIDLSDPLDCLVFSLAQQDIGKRGPALRQLIRLPDPRVEDRLFAVLRVLDFSWDDPEHNSEASLVDDDLLQRSIQWIVSRRAAQALPALLRAVADNHLRVKVIAIKALGELGDPAVLESTLQAIKEYDQLEDLLESVLDDLGTLVTPDAVAFLLPLFIHGTPSQQSLAEYLLQQAGTAAVPSLLSLLPDQNAALRCQVISLLGKLGDPRATPVLLAALHDEDEQVRLQSIEALCQLCDARGPQELLFGDANQLGEVLRALENIRTPRLVDLLVDATLSGIGDVVAFDALTRLYRLVMGESFPSATVAREQLTDLLPVLLDDPDDLVRGEATVIAGLLGSRDGRIVERLIAALADPMRIDAVHALGDLGDPRAVEPLIAALAAVQHGPAFETGRDSASQFEAGMGDTYGMRRDAIIIALGKLGDPRATEALIATLDDSGFYVVSSAIQALGQLRDQRAIKPLLALLMERQETEAVDALAAIGGPRVSEVLTTLLIEQQNYPDFLWSSVAKALRTLRQPAPDVLIARLSQAGSLLERCDTAKALGLLGDPRSIDLLLALLTNTEEEPLLRGTAARALGELGDERAMRPLLDTLTGDLPRIVRGSVLLALAHMNKLHVMKSLLAALHDNEPVARAVAASVLGIIGDAQVLPALRAMQEREATRDDDFQGYPIVISDLGLVPSPDPADEMLPEEFATEAIKSILQG